MGLRLFIWLLIPSFCFATTQRVGKVFYNNQPVSDAIVTLSNQWETSTDSLGQFQFQLTDTQGVYITIYKEGYHTEVIPTSQWGEQTSQTIHLKKQEWALKETIVKAYKSPIKPYQDPVVIHSLSKKSFEQTQSINLAEGLHFSPGVRVENNCQNCGFTQVRMNGLQGPYAQILLNGRPIFSAMAGVYGLEMIPASMIEKVEVVRGGGSVLQGGGAIAGTINVVTKQPQHSEMEIGFNQNLTNLTHPDQSYLFNGSIVANDTLKGVSFFAYHRDRKPWDANGDGFSEMTALKNTTIGLDGYWTIGKQQMLKWGVFHIDEYRRGGNDFALMPHQSQLAEQLTHAINSLHVSFEHRSQDSTHLITFYHADQFIKRNSYYGSGGRVLLPTDTITEEDLLALNAYGQSQDWASNTGLLHHFKCLPSLTWTNGLEHKYNRVKDAMPGYFRQINQRVHTYSFVSQIDYDWRDKWCMMLGARLDHYTINGRHLLLNTSYQDQLNRTVLVPRIAVLYHINPIQQVRLSFTRGYRGPQAFDEDLHIETVGGAAKFIQLDPHLQSETSQSWTGSYQFYKTMPPSITGQLLIEGFHTTLRHPFILTNPYELPNGTSVVTKSNGDKAYVYGSTVELNLSYKNNIQWQSGITYQSAQYSKAIEIWAPQNDKDLTPKVVTKNLLRTPSFYGFYTLTVFPNKLFDISYNCVITGRMHIGHVTDSETEYIQLKTTRSFWEHQLKLNYKYPIQKGAQLHIYFGITNLTNQYQKDFDMGMHRDATYIYGPNRPRTLFFGCKLLLDGSIKKG